MQPDHIDPVFAVTVAFIATVTFLFLEWRRKRMTYYQAQLFGLNEHQRKMLATLANNWGVQYDDGELADWQVESEAEDA